MKEMGSMRGATSVVPLQDPTIVVTKLFNIAVNNFGTENLLLVRKYLF